LNESTWVTGVLTNVRVQERFSREELKIVLLQGCVSIGWEMSGVDGNAPRAFVAMNDVD